jgi:hypothetical protein
MSPRTVAHRVSVKASRFAKFGDDLPPYAAAIAGDRGCHAGSFGIKNRVRHRLP